MRGVPDVLPDRRISGFAIVPDDALLLPVQCDGPGEAPWQERDVALAAGAAEEAGLSAYRVELGPEGTISIIVVAPNRET